MKKAIIITISVIFAIILIFTGAYFIFTAPENDGSFSINEFKGQIANPNFHSNNNYGKISDFKSAANVGKTAIADRFENASGNIFRWMKCTVKYDEENDAYYVFTYRVNPNVFGSIYNVIIKSVGPILAIWGQK